MKAHVKQWGNSLAVRIPKPAADALNLQDNAEVELVIADGSLIVTPATTESLAQLVLHITPVILHPEARQ